MKSLILILVYIALFFGGYIILSACGMLFVDKSFLEITRTLDWAIPYTAFLHWFICCPVVSELHEYFEEQEKLKQQQPTVNVIHLNTHNRSWD